MDETKMLGIVFNGDNRPLAGYYGKYYDGYYHQPSGTGAWQHSGKRDRKPRRQSWP
jgi:hypothetical protein